MHLDLMDPTVAELIMAKAAELSLDILDAMRREKHTMQLRAHPGPDSISWTLCLQAAEETLGELNRGCAREKNSL